MSAGTPLSRSSPTMETSPETPVRNAFLSPPRRKERRNPSVTPRRFARFFGGPSGSGQGSSQHGSEGGHLGPGHLRGSRLALSDVDGSTMNSQHTHVKRKLFDNEDSASTPSPPAPEPLSKRTRTELYPPLPFSDENLPFLSHRLGPQALDEVLVVSRTSSH